MQSGELLRSSEPNCAGWMRARGVEMVRRVLHQATRWRLDK